MLSASSSTNGFETDLGARVRKLRRERGLTLKGLGRLAGLSHPFLSQVERGLARPSVGSVERIAAALDVTVAHLWAPTRDGVHVLRADEGVLEQRDGATLRALPGNPALLEWSARTRRWPELETQRGELAIYVSRGSIEVEVGGTVHPLDEGDTIRFDGAIPHRMRRTGGTGTRALIVAS